MTHSLPDLPAEWDDAGDAGDAGDADGARFADAGGVPPDPWSVLRRHTPARISLGRAGTSLPTAEVLRFAAAHAQARDAVHLPLDADALAADLQARGIAPLRARSRVATRTEYLARPDLGRRLDDASRDALERHARGDGAPCVVVADGLSAIAGQAHAAALVGELARALDGVALGPVVIATQARVALGDEIGAALRAALVIVLIGERPGLSSPDSLGAYLTWAPRVGRVDSERNCVSNIRPEGLALPAAAGRIAWLVRESLRRRVSGVALKDDSEVARLADGAA